MIVRGVPSAGSGADACREVKDVAKGADTTTQAACDGPDHQAADSGEHVGEVFKGPSDQSRLSGGRAPATSTKPMLPEAVARETKPR